MDRAPGVSLCMIVRDEERFVGDALASAAGAVDELCVVDTGSTDRTVEIARAAGARVGTFSWCDDFAAARNAALDLAARRWIFVLDADERLAPEGVAELQAVGRSPAGRDGRYVRIRNLSDAIAGSGAMTNAVVRLFPNDPRIRFAGAVHEHVALDGAPTALAARATGIEIVHHGYLAAVVRERDKVQRNLRISRRVAAERPDDAFAWYNFGMSSMLAGDRAAARDALARVQRLTAGQPRGFRPPALIALGDLELAAGDAAAALAAGDACALDVPTYPDAHFLRGRALATLGRRPEARAAFERAIAAGAHAADHFVVDDEIAIWKAENEIAATLMAEGRYADALARLDRALAARPAAQPVVFNRAYCLEELGELAAAQVVFAGAAAAYRDERAAAELVAFLVRRAPPERLIEALETAAPLVDRTAQPPFLIAAAAVAFRDGDVPRARGYADAARAIDAGRAAALIPALAQRFGLPAFAAAVAPATVTEIGFVMPYSLPE